MEDHITLTTDPDYDVVVHPAFASECTLTSRSDGSVKTLYRQDRSKAHDCRGKGHPKKHTIKLKGKGNRRDITITIDDPDHSVASLALELYPEGRDPTAGDETEPTDTFTVMNNAFTCPPHCDE